MGDYMVVKDTKILAEIDWFNKELFYLKDTFVAWIEADGHKVEINEEKIVNNEGPSGQYDTFKYAIAIDGKIKLCLVPYGIWIVAARGRVDISGPSGSEKLVYLNKGGPVTRIEIGTGNYSENTTHRQFNNIDEDGWYWYDDSTIRKMIKLSKEIFGYLIGRVQ
jgi:hypothetical protein